MLKYLPKSVYVQKVKTVKQMGMWNSLGVQVCAGDGHY